MRNGLVALAVTAFVSVAAAQSLVPSYDLGKVFREREASYKIWAGNNGAAEQRLDDLKAQSAMLVKEAGSAADPSRRTVASPPVIWRTQGSPSDLWDASDLPPMVVVPAGAFTMGLAPNADNKNDTRHPVTIAAPYALGKYPVTRAEFAHFVVDTGYQARGPCSVRQGEKWELDPNKGWRAPGFDQTPHDPVVCVSWNDAVAYAAWASGKTGHKYRLPSAAEYEYAAAAGAQSIFWFGDEGDHEYMNYGSDDLCPGGACRPLAKGRDQWLYTSPVGAFPANPFGLYDMNGNIRQWVADCDSSYPVGSPVDGGPDTANCSKRRQRSGSWNSIPAHSFPQGDHTEQPDYRSSSLGFRLARSL